MNGIFWKTIKILKKGFFSYFHILQKYRKFYVKILIVFQKKKLNDFVIFSKVGMKNFFSGNLALKIHLPKNAIPEKISVKYYIRKSKSEQSFCFNIMHSIIFMYFPKMFL